MGKKRVIIATFFDTFRNYKNHSEIIKIIKISWKYGPPRPGPDFDPRKQGPAGPGAVPPVSARPKPESVEGNPRKHVQNRKKTSRNCQIPEFPGFSGFVCTIVHENVQKMHKKPQFSYIFVHVALFRKISQKTRFFRLCAPTNLQKKREISAFLQNVPCRPLFNEWGGTR